MSIPSFTANAAQAALAFQQTPKRTECTDFWTVVLRAGQTGNSPDRIWAVQCRRHAGRRLIDGGSGLLELSTAPDAGLEEFCCQVGTRFRLVQDPEAIEQSISRAYLNLLARHEIRYQSLCPEATSLKLRVHTPSVWAEATMPLP